MPTDYDWSTQHQADPEESYPGESLGATDPSKNVWAGLTYGGGGLDSRGRPRLTFTTKRYMGNLDTTLRGMDPSYLQDLSTDLTGVMQPQDLQAALAWQQASNPYGTLTKSRGTSDQFLYGQNANFVGFDTEGNPINITPEYYGFVQEHELGNYVPGWNTTAAILGWENPLMGSDPANFWAYKSGAYGGAGTPWENLEPGTNIEGILGYGGTGTDGRPRAPVTRTVTPIPNPGEPGYVPPGGDIPGGDGGGNVPGGGGNIPGGGGDYPPPSGGGGDNYPPGGGDNYPPGGGSGYPPPSGIGPGDEGPAPYWDDWLARAQAFYEQASGIGGDQDPYNIDVDDMEAITREVDPNELAGTRLAALLDPNSVWAQRAMQQGRDEAASRGLMNSSIAAGNAMGAFIDRANPLALSEAEAYGRVGSENMAARNAAAAQNQNIDLQSQLAEVGYDAQRDADLRSFLLGQATDLNRAFINVEGREDTQAFEQLMQQLQQQWQTGERLGGQEWQTGERLGGQQWQTGERIGAQQFQSAENTLQRGHEMLMADRSMAWQTAERVAQQGFTTSERQAIQAFERGERLDTQDWNDQQRRAAETFQRDRDALDALLQREGISATDRQYWLAAWTGVQTGLFNSIGQAAAQIYANTNLTAEQQQAAVKNMIAFYAGLAPQMPTAPPGITFPGQQSTGGSGYPTYPTFPVNPWGTYVPNPNPGVPYQPPVTGGGGSDKGGVARPRTYPYQFDFGGLT